MINVVESTMSRYGLRSIHAVDFMAPIEVAAMRELVPMECKEYAGFYPVYEHDLKINHMFAVWEAREMVDLTGIQCKDKPLITELPLKYGVLWFVLKGETLSLSIELAAAMFKEKTGKFPTAVWVEKLPKGAPEVYETADEGHEISLPIHATEWAPERFVVVGMPKAEWDLVWVDGRFEASPPPSPVTGEGEKDKKNE